MKAIYEAPFACNTASAFPKVAVDQPVTFADNLSVDKVLFDVQPYVVQAVKQVNAAVDAHFIGILREAFEAGRDRGVDEHSSTYWGDSATEPDFEEWLEAKLQEIRCSDSL